MARWNRTTRVVAVVATIASAACSDQSPVAPGEVNLARASSESVPGTYVISFLKEAPGGLAPAADVEPVGTYLVLKSQVRDAAGNLATSGTVRYEYCWAGGDYAPSSSCANGSGVWKRHWSVRVDPVGSLLGFGACSTPRTIGFRFTFSGSRSGIANGTSEPKDFTWAAVQ